MQCKMHCNSNYGNAILQCGSNYCNFWGCLVHVHQQAKNNCSSYYCSAALHCNSYYCSATCISIVTTAILSCIAVVTTAMRFVISAVTILLLWIQETCVVNMTTCLDTCNGDNCLMGPFKSCIDGAARFIASCHPPWCHRDLPLLSA